MFPAMQSTPAHRLDVARDWVLCCALVTAAVTRCGSSAAVALPQHARQEIQPRGATTVAGMQAEAPSRTWQRNRPRGAATVADMYAREGEGDDVVSALKKFQKEYRDRQVAVNALPMPQMQQNHADSGVQLFPGVNFRSNNWPGDPLSQITSLPACRQLCVETPGCLAFSYSKTSWRWSGCRRKTFFPRHGHSDIDFISGRIVQGKAHFQTPPVSRNSGTATQWAEISNSSDPTLIPGHESRPFPSPSCNSNALKPPHVWPVGINGFPSQATATSLPWNPNPERFLFGLCSWGQMGNRLLCLHNYMLVAALLNRTLVLPREMPLLRRQTKRRDYDLEWVLDRERFRLCLGRYTLLFDTEYMARFHSETIPVDLQCWYPNCVMDLVLDEECETLPRVIPQITLLNGTCNFDAIPDDFGYAWEHIDVDWLVSRFGDNPSTVLSFGDIYSLKSIQGLPPSFMGIFSEAFSHAQGCRQAVMPSNGVLQAATKFMSRNLLEFEQRFVAAHVRRGDWWRHCWKNKWEACWISLAKIGECLSKRMLQLGISTLFLASNANREEVRFLRATMETYFPKGALHLVRLPLADFSQKGSFFKPNDAWWGPLVEQGWTDDPQLKATVEEVICAHSDVFYSNPGSSFSLDITRLRIGYGKRSCHDEDICGVGINETVIHP
eukprot:TRINITY_DN781_c0_g1_i1.p1 TRINITY_DN781_c0_g1~~TRINITY_DN781_c0_g1_i1.p1  ORF type:complete len:667 (+),score=25.01 TRINITY_DN781_c0_g1_i1:237-2237(+)